MGSLLCMCVSVCVLVMWLNCAHSQDVMPVSLKVAAGDSLYLAWQAQQGPLRACTALTPWGDAVTLGTAGRLTYWGAGLSQGACGVKADSLQLGRDNGTWTLVATGETTTQHYTNVTVVESTVEGLSRNVTVDIENYLLVECGPKDVVLYCELTSPSNETTILRLKKCQLEIFKVEFQHSGVWKCRYLLPYQTSEVYAFTTVNVVTNTVNFEVGQNETETELNVFCNHVVKPVEKVAGCSVVPPNGRGRMMLAAGSGLSRYRYYGFAPFHCGVAISKPLVTEDYGPWLCEMIYNSQNHKGGYVHIKHHTDKADSIKPLKSKPSVVILSDKLPLVVSCAVPTSLVYCWLQHPNSTVFSVNPSQSYPNYKYFGQGFDFGECGISIASPAVNDSGTWVCGMGLRQPGDSIDSQELTTSVNVVVSDLPLAVVEPGRVVQKGEELVVGCAMVIPQAVNYCRFWKPDHAGLTISNVHTLNTSSSDRYQYGGEGLFVGDCRLRIRSVTSSDLGRWLCATTPAYARRAGELTVIFDINLRSDSLSLAAGFGIAAGVLIAVAAIVAAVVCRHRRRVKSRCSTEALGDPTRLDELESETGSSYETSAAQAPINISRKRVFFNRRAQIS